MEIIRKCDLLTVPISLSYKDNYLFRTSLGGVLSILIALIMLFSILLGILDLVNRTTYSVISSELIDLSEEIDFTNFPFFFHLMTSKGENIPYDPKLYTYYIIQSDYRLITDNEGLTQTNVITTEINFTNCNNLQNQKEYFKYFPKFNMSQFQCIVPGQNIKIHGNLGDVTNGFRGFIIYVKKCDKTKYNCYDEKKINSTLGNVKFHYYYLGYIIDHKNAKGKNVNYKTYSSSINLSINFMKKFAITFSKGKYYLYNSLFTNKMKEFDFFLYSGYTFDIDKNSDNSLTSDNNNIGYIAINSDSKVVEYIKNVRKFTDLVAEIGGVFNIILSICKIINNYISQKILFVDIYKELFAKSAKFHYKKISRNLIRFNLGRGYNNNNKIINFTNANYLNIKSKNKNSIDHYNKNVENIYKSNAIKDDNINNKNNSKELENEPCDKNDKNNNSNIILNKSKNCEFENKSPISRKSISERSVNIDNKFSRYMIYYYICPFNMIKKIKKLYNIKAEICRNISIEKFYEIMEQLDGLLGELYPNNSNKNYNNFYSYNYVNEIPNKIKINKKK